MSEAPRRIRLSRAKGWRMPENTVKVARPTMWGNPFKIGGFRCTGAGVDYQQEPVSDAATAVRFFRDALAIADRNFQNNEAIRRRLSGKNLACWCALDQPCHADVLLEIANAPLTPAPEALALIEEARAARTAPEQKESD